MRQIHSVFKIAIMLFIAAMVASCPQGVEVKLQETGSRITQVNKGIEVDFVTSLSGFNSETLIPIEVKASKKVDSHSLSNLKQFLSFSGLKRGVMFALESPRKVQLDAIEIEILPIYLDPP